KGIKITVLAILGVVVLAIIGLVVLVSAFDAEKYKPELVKAVKDKTGRTLVIGDPLKLTLFPSLGLDTGRVALSESGSNKPFARIGKLHASVRVLPLLARQVVLDRIELSGLAADVVRHKDGSTNIDDLISGDKGTPASPGKEKKPQPGEAPGAVQFDVGGVD